MRVKRLTTWLVLGVAVALAYSVRRRRGGPHRRAVPAAPPAPPEPRAPFDDPVGLWDGSAEVDPAVIARTDEVASMFVEAIAEGDGGSELDLGVTEATPGDAARGAGDLYGGHVTPAVDRELPDDDEAQAEGENWLEHLQASSAELGPEPERVLDMSDDSDPHAGHHKTETRDTPVADHGAAGPRGL